MTAKIIETHISWIILTGKYAYKIKKPLDLEFLDYSSLAKRKFYCEEELRLNKIYAPELYIKVISFKKNNKIIDYAVVMNQFEQKYLFANLLKSGELLAGYFIDLAEQMAKFHQTAEIAPGKFGSLENIWFPVQQNFDQIRPYLLKAEDSPKLLGQLEICENWAREQFEKYQKIFKSRKKLGFIRECHGDLHLGNIVLYQDKPVIFDRIEFNDNFRYTDTMGDIGFLLMDLDEKNQAELGNIFLNQYLTLTGDYEGLSILRFYQAYRAVVRAKIKLMGPSIDWDDYKLSINLAEKYAQDINNISELFIMHGISGSGKTTRAKKLAQQYRAIHIRSDVERKRICQDKNKLYTEDVNRKVYDRLYKLAEELLHQGYSVVVDATFLKKTERDKFRKLSSRFHIVPCEIDDKLRKIWLEDRRQDYSDADYPIAQQQQKTIELLTPEERKYIYV